VRSASVPNLTPFQLPRITHGLSRDPTRDEAQPSPLQRYRYETPEVQLFIHWRHSRSTETRRRRRTVHSTMQVYRAGTNKYLGPRAPRALSWRNNCVAARCTGLDDATLATANIASRENLSARCDGASGSVVRHTRHNIPGRHYQHCRLRHIQHTLGTVPSVVAD
jgi:hypothetical protein